MPWYGWLGIAVFLMAVIVIFLGGVATFRGLAGEDQDDGAEFEPDFDAQIAELEQETVTRLPS